jgi:hypothetical protein
VGPCVDFSCDAPACRAEATTHIVQKKEKVQIVSPPSSVFVGFCDIGDSKEGAISFLQIVREACVSPLPLPAPPPHQMRHQGIRIVNHLSYSTSHGGVDHKHNIEAEAGVTKAELG